MRRPMTAPIVSFKHQRNEDITYLGTNANNVFRIYLGGAPGSASASTNVPAGNRVYSIDVTVNYVVETANSGSTFSWMVAHFRSGQDPNALFPGVNSNWTTIGSSNGRNQVIKSYMGVVGTEDGGLLRHNIHIKIPKQWHRVREGDTLELFFAGSEAGILSIGTRFKNYS